MSDAGSESMSVGALRQMLQDAPENARVVFAHDGVEHPVCIEVHETEGKVMICTISDAYFADHFAPLIAEPVVT